MTQQEHIGMGSIKSIKGTLQTLYAKKILLVMEEASYSASGARVYMESISPSFKIKTYCGFAVNPNVEDLESGIKVFADACPDAVIAIGGGSVIDMAKMINFFI